MTGEATDLVARFWGKVEKGGPDECWPWKGSAAPRGYGRIYDQGRNRVATHVSLEIATGKPFPAGLMACHKCDNPPCVNPSHLFIGTMSDNIKDAVAKGRVSTDELDKGRGVYNKVKTHCVRGHLYAGDNLQVTPSTGGRKCLECRAIYDARYQAKQKEKRAARRAFLASRTERADG